jgi:hypothetical protein
VPELVLTSEDLTVHIDVDPVRSAGTEDHGRHGLLVKVTTETGTTLAARQPRLENRHAQTSITGLPPGTHTLTVSGATLGSPVLPVTAAITVWDPTTTG